MQRILSTTVLLPSSANHFGRCSPTSERRAHIFQRWANNQQACKGDVRFQSRKQGADRYTEISRNCAKAINNSWSVEVRYCGVSPRRSTTGSLVLVYPFRPGDADVMDD